MTSHQYILIVVPCVVVFVLASMTVIIVLICKKNRQHINETNYEEIDLNALNQLKVLQSSENLQTGANIDNTEDDRRYLIPQHHYEHRNEASREQTSPVV